MALTTNLAGYWKLDESSGNVSDSSGNNNTLTNTNAVTFSSGKINNGATFASVSSQYFTIANASQTGLNITGDLSIAGWIQFASLTNGTNQAAVNRDTSGTRGYNFTCEPQVGNTTIKWIFFDGVNLKYSNVLTPTLNTWYHAAVVYTASAGTADYYWNGASAGTATGLNTSLPSTTNNFDLGREGS